MRGGKNYSRLHQFFCDVACQKLLKFASALRSYLKK